MPVGYSLVIATFLFSSKQSVKSTQKQEKASTLNTGSTKLAARDIKVVRVVRAK